MKDEYLNHKDFIKSLKNPSLDIYHKVYHKNKKRRGKPVNKPTDGRMTLTKLAKIVSDGFTELRQDIKNINTRLDNVEKRLDNVDTRLDLIEKRLDYNNLKKLPENR